MQFSCRLRFDSGVSHGLSTPAAPLQVPERPRLSGLRGFYKTGPLTLSREKDLSAHHGASTKHLWCKT